MLCSGVYNPEEDRYVPHHQSETKEEITIVIKLQKGKTESKGRLLVSIKFFFFGGGSLKPVRRKKKTNKRVEFCKQRKAEGLGGGKWQDYIPEKKDSKGTSLDAKESVLLLVMKEIQNCWGVGERGESKED